LEKTILKEVKLQPKELHVDYDGASDVLYISFGKPQPAYDSTLPEDGVIYRLSGDKLVGISILNFRGRTGYKRAKN